MQHNFIDRIHQRFGRLIVVARAENKNNRIAWRCLCDCGKEIVTNAFNLSGGRTQSCGCLQSEATAAANALRIKHGQARGHNPSREWHSWKCMHNRCSLPSSHNWYLYGGRGIKVCDEWSGKAGFAVFYKDMGARPKGTSLDRIETNGNYEPANCKWSTPKEQANNRRPRLKLHKENYNDNRNKPQATTTAA